MPDMTNESYQLLNPKSKIALYTVYGILYAILFLFLILPLMLFRDSVGDWQGIYTIVSLAVLAAALVYVIAAPQIFYRHYKYALTGDSIDVLRGIVIIRRTVVPIERIHQVEVTRGPVNNILGLADVDVTTAGGVAKIQFLDISVANSIAEELNDYINGIIRDRKKND
ncbi:MAG: PH domain-containing protein [Candidatus Methanoplasma sp.]|jgi:membrane protein YdbS with pleckstrin-like domain|nr:PH domain-containing protein [Candidatus Methanoplasma sp.]